MPSASNEDDMVFAVYMPPQAPTLGQAFFSMPSKSSFAHLAGGERAHRLERRDDGELLALPLSRA